MHAMKSRSLRRAAVFAIAALLPDPIPAAQTAPKKITVQLNPAQTEIRWTLSDVLHTVHGTFAMKSGTIVIDPSTGHAVGEVRVQLDSGNSGNATRDRLMKENILQTASYPEAIFRPEKISSAPRPGAEQRITVDGTFTIHGKDHPLEIVMTVRMNGADQLTATTEFVVPYVAWGMKDPSTFVLRVEKQVTVDVAAQGAVSSSGAAP